MHDENMASDPATFWQQRETLTPTTDMATDIGGYRLVLLIDVADPTVLAAYRSVSEALERFTCLDTSPAESLHLTIKLFDIDVDPSAAKDCSSAVQQVDQTASEVLAHESPFEATVTQFNLFPDVVYGEVTANGRLSDLNRVIFARPEVTTLDRDEDQFIPHVTFGYFEDDTDFEALVSFLETNRELSFPPITVDEVKLVAYEVGGRPPAYDRIATYEL
jgi:2'-5' RNA ligase